MMRQRLGPAAAFFSAAPFRHGLVQHDHVRLLSAGISQPPAQGMMHKIRRWAAPSTRDEDVSGTTNGAHKMPLSSDENAGEISRPREDNFEGIPSEVPISSILLLNIVAVLWGTQHAVAKIVVADSEAAPFTLLRFALAALIASPYTPGAFLLGRKGESADDAKMTWRWGAEMGLWMFLGFSFQAIGLGSTTAQRSGFLLYLNVKLVPFLSRVLLGRPISAPTWLSALAAFLGTALLALDGQSIGFNQGDIWSITAAAFSAMFIIRLEKATAAVAKPAELNAACLWTVTLLAAIWTFLPDLSTTSHGTSTVDQISSIIFSHPLELLYLGGVTTALANYIQAKGQKDVSPERASVIYSLDPVYGALFSYLLLGEKLGGTQAFIGAGIITVTAATNAFLDFGDKARISESHE